MTTDNRTTEPTDYAALIEELREDALDAGHIYEEQLLTKAADAIAALVAAQGAAPQAESEELAWYKRAAKHSADSMAEARATLQQLADRVDPFVFDELSSVLDDQPLDYETGWAIGEAAPVLPSSTAPQAEREYVYCPIHGDLLAARRSFVCEHAKRGHEYAAPELPSSGVDEDAEALAKYRSRQKQEATNYRDWKRQNRGYGISELLTWAREAQDNVRFAAGWITHEDYRRAVVPQNLIPLLGGREVDVDALAEVIARVSHRAMDPGTNPRVECIDSAEVARAVIASRAEWLKR